MRSILFRFILFCVLALTFISSVAIAEPAVQRNCRVLIDPAHGGADFGVNLGEKKSEKDITLAVALLLKKYLEQNDRHITVQLTRSTDKTVSMADRVNAVKVFKADLMVSLHVNAGFGPDASGFEIAFPGLKTLGNHGDEGIVKNMEKTKYSNDSIRLAQMIQKNLETVFPRKGRGLREVPVPLLAVLNAPSICVELGFLTNNSDKNKLLDKNGQQDIARAISRGIRDYLNL